MALAFGAAYRTQSGKLARNMRMALPNAAFIGFTGTPLFKHDQLTKRIFGDYVSRYDFKRSEEDGATVKLVYENRGEKLGLAKLDLNEKIAAAVDAADLNPDQTALLEKLLGKDYEVITADERLARIASDFVEHCSTRWEAGKAMLVCIDKVTCARMLKLIGPLWKAKAAAVRAEAHAKLAAIALAADDEARQVLHAQRDRLLAKAAWMAALADAIAVTEAHLLGLGFDAGTLLGAKGFGRIQLLADAVDAVYTSDESKRRYEILCRVVFARFKALLVEPSALVYAERHDNLEAIYKKLSERRDTADVSELLKVLHRIVNTAIATHGVGSDQASGLTVDLSQINMEKLRDEFAQRVKRKATAIEDIRQIVEEKLADMLARNPLRMNYEKAYQDIIAAYNQDKDRATVEDTFAKLAVLEQSLTAEQSRAIAEGLSEDQLALFDLVNRDGLSKTDRERIKQASKDLLAGVLAVIAPLDRWTEKEQTQAEVETFVLDQIYQTLPEPPYSPEDKASLAQRVYRHIWQQSLRDRFSRNRWA